MHSSNHCFCCYVCMHVHNNNHDNVQADSEKYEMKGHKVQCKLNPYKL